MIHKNGQKKLRKRPNVKFENQNLNKMIFHIDLKKANMAILSTIPNLNKSCEHRKYSHCYKTVLLNPWVATNVSPKRLLSVRGMKGRMSSDGYYPRQESFGFLSQNQSVL